MILQGSGPACTIYHCIAILPLKYQPIKTFIWMIKLQLHITKFALTLSVLDLLGRSCECAFPTTLERESSEAAATCWLTM